MAERMPEAEQGNYDTFRDCLSEPILRALAAPVEKARRRGKNAKKGKEKGGEVVRAGEAVERTSDDDGDAAADLGDFIDVRRFAHDACMQS